MLHTVSIKLSRKTLDTTFQIEPQEIDTEAPISIKLLTSVENTINNLTTEVECFNLTINLILSITTVIDKYRVSKSVNATIVDILDYYNNNLIKEPIKLGKV